MDATKDSFFSQSKRNSEKKAANTHDAARQIIDAEAAARAAQGQAVGSDHWLDAQTALAELDTYRSDLSAMLTDVEQLAIDRAAAGEPDYPGVEQLRDRVKAAFDAESARIGAIQAMLPAA